MDKITHHLTDKVIAPHSMRLFSTLVYAWFLINVMLVWNVKDLLWGPHNVFYRQGQADSFIENFFYQLIYDATRFKVIFAIHILSAFIGISEKTWSFLPRIFAWATGWILFYAAVQAFNSGMMIMLSLAFFCSIVYAKATGVFRITLTNVARYACIIQISLVYLVASVYKLSGAQWLAGDAMYYTLNIDQFSSSMWIDSWMLKSCFVMKSLTYFALIYQFLFPVMIWIKKGRNLYLLIGVAFHLFIGIFMHLWDFALAMIFAYALFFDDAFAKRMLQLFRRKARGMKVEN